MDAALVFDQSWPGVDEAPAACLDDVPDVGVGDPSAQVQRA
jgi:hypothetical protein